MSIPSSSSTTSTVRRIKERGGGGGKITPLLQPTKTLTPISQFGTKSIEKDNPKSISRVFSNPPQKPTIIRPMPRISDVEKPRSRSRGRASSPCDFNRVLSDFRKTRVSSVDSSGSRVFEKKGFRDLNHRVGGRVSIDGKENGNLRKKDLVCVKLDVNDDSGGNKDGSFKGINGNVMKNIGKKEFNCVKLDVNGDIGNNKDGSFKGINGNVGKIVGKKELGCVKLDVNGDSGNNKDGSFKGINGNVMKNVGKKELGCVKLEVNDDSGNNKDGSFKGINGNVVKSVGKKELDFVTLDVNGDSGNKDGGFKGINGGNLRHLKVNVGSSVEKSGVGVSSKGLSVRTVSGLNGLDDSKEKGVNGEGSSGRVGSKHTSKLHEKLAYLEGKVKRIASDIKKTKEMLDMNNTDASKVILSDIQEKISGIEKAMGSVIADTNEEVSLSNVGVSKCSEKEGLKTMYEENQNDSSKVSVKELSSEELEARLYPHHKLLRNQTTLLKSGSKSQTDRTRDLDPNGGSNSMEEDPIAMEFLASLNKTPSEVDSDVNKVQETEATETSKAGETCGEFSGKIDDELNLEADEKLDEFDDDQENKAGMVVEEEMDDESVSQVVELGSKTSTGGWFVSEGESVLLAHDDGSCSFYDIANHEEKAEYRPPAGISENIWRDCWIIRAPSADGCSGKYVVAASAGNTMDSGFCSWDFYTKDMRAFHIEDGTSNPRVALGPLPDNIMYRRNALSNVMSFENRQWWYRPCGPLIVSTASCQRGVKVFDIRDGEHIMRWDVQKPVVAMEYCSPLQWRNRGKVVIAESEGISLWDVSSMNSRALLSVSTSGRRISALHVNNTDAELGGGVRQRVSSSEAEGNDGVFCTADSINILDFRQPSGIGLKIPKIGISVQSLSSRGDSIFLGCSNIVSSVKKQVNSQVLQFSIRKQKTMSTYALPESNAHSHHKALTQVWGNSNSVMAVCGLGLFVFDALKNEGLPSFVSEYTGPQSAKEIIGPDDMYSPSFDCLSSQVLLISRDRPAMWRHLS